MDKNKAWGLKSGESAGEETRPQPRLRTVDRGQMVLRPTDVEQLIEAEHPARAMWEIVGQQNLDGYYVADVQELCDRMAVLHDGELRFVGAPQELTARYATPDLENAFLQCIGAA